MVVFLVGCKKEVKICGKKDNRPNIIFLMDDQHRYNALGVLNSEIKTPTLDSLARNGVLFTQAVCQVPMCVPSRNSLMFGLLPNQTGVYRNAGGGVPDSLMPGKTMAQYFKDAGYETAGFGKAHWGKFKTNTRGFETRYVSEIPEKGAISMAEVNPEAKAKYDAEVAPMGPGEENNIGYLGFTSKLPEKDHRDGWITKQAINYLKKRNDERPLFFYLSYMKPHAGNNIPKGYEDLYNLDSITYVKQPQWSQDYSPHAAGDNRNDMYINFWKNASEKQWKLMTMRYYANVSWIDDMMGRVLAELRKKGLLENSIIIFTSDHGEMLGARYYRFNKYCLYDPSVRVPMILAGTALPKSVKRNTKNPELVENIDVLPTLLSVAGIKPDRELPGKSLVTPIQRNANFSELHERKGQAAFMWRTKDYKLILVLKRKNNVNDYSKDDIITGEFYDLKNDPNEWYDLYNTDKFSDIQKAFKNDLLDFLKSMKQ
ncbi:arylsulfatase [Gaetbulibacter aestuarii]